MNDNIILYAISLICIILLLIEWIFISHKKCSINAIVFVGYSFPLYYLMIYKGAGGAAFTWWFYLVLFTSIHVIILLIILFYFFIVIYCFIFCDIKKYRFTLHHSGCKVSTFSFNYQ